jgi:hypothetical protein
VRKSVLGLPWARAMAVAPPMEFVDGPVMMTRLLLVLRFQLCV